MTTTRIGGGRFETYRDRKGGWRWRLISRNGRIVADSGEGYTRRVDARLASERVRRIARAASIDHTDGRSADVAHGPAVKIRTPTRYATGRTLLRVVAGGRR